MRWSDAFEPAADHREHDQLGATYYLAAVAVAIGFKMNLFNIGVDGQYRLAAMLSAAVAGAAFMTSLPGSLRIVITLLVAMVVGAAWAGVAALLKVDPRGQRGDQHDHAERDRHLHHRLPAEAGRGWRSLRATTSRTREDHRGRLAADHPAGSAGSTPPLYSLVFLAVIVGVIYALVLSRTVFGFSLRATGLSESAALASGISVKKMIVVAMLLSGAVAGSGRHAGAAERPGPRVRAELPRPASASPASRSPCSAGTTRWAWSSPRCCGRRWTRRRTRCRAVQVPRELVTIMQGVIVLSVVVAYEFVRRYRLVLDARDVASALAAPRRSAKQVTVRHERRFRGRQSRMAGRPGRPAAQAAAAACGSASSPIGLAWSRWSGC